MAELTELSPLQPLMTPNGWYCSQQYYGGEKKSSDYYCQKRRSPDTNTVGQRTARKESSATGNNIALPFKSTNSILVRQIAGVEKTFYKHPTTVHGCIREVFFFFHLKCLSLQGSWRTSCPLHFPHLTYEENRVQRD